MKYLKRLYCNTLYHDINGICFDETAVFLLVTSSESGQVLGLESKFDALEIKGRGVFGVAVTKFIRSVISRHWE